MLQAYLRGLLKPEYSFGLRSIARENMMLHAACNEVLLPYKQMSHSLNSGIVSTLTGIKRQELYEQLSKSVSESTEQCLSQKVRKSKTVQRKDVALIDIFNILAKRGIIDATET